MLRNQKTIALFFAMLCMAVSCTKEESITDTQETPKLVAEIEIFEEDEATRYNVNPSSLDKTSAPSYYWNPGDEIGVWTTNSQSNLRYVNTNTKDATTASFSPASDVNAKGIASYAYYPYDANAGTSATSLSGNLPHQQTIDKDMLNIPGKYMTGTANILSLLSSQKFSFKHLFSTVRFRLNAADTELDGEELQSVNITVTRSGKAVNFCGDFSFNIKQNTYSASANVSNSVNIEFAGTPKMEGNVVFFTSMFPTIKSGDIMTFTVMTQNYTATFDAKVTTTMQKNSAYTYTLSMASYDPEITANNPEQPETPVEPENPIVPEDPIDPDPDVPSAPVEPETPVIPQPEVVTGTFKCATYNIKSSTNSKIGTTISADNWDFFSLSEDFGKYSKNLSGYAFGKRSASAISFFGSDPKDGLAFATRSATCSWSGEYIDAYDSEYGGLLDGANTVVDKGFRHYVVTMKDGVEVDVYITHMNTYDTQKHLDCQHAQLKEVATYIANHQNGRPVIFMGDTNCRYTRHDFETYFWSILRNAGLEYADPWVEYQWNGTYPTYPSKSLMVSDATGTNSDTDIICSTTQNGEVVDKVIYINKPTNKVQIKANNYLRDMDYNGLSDHMPIVVDFTYSYTK